jgi:hypothetical protein
MASVGQTWISSLADALGTNDNALRLLISLLLGKDSTVVHKDPVTYEIVIIYPLWCISALKMLRADCEKKP